MTFYNIYIIGSISVSNIASIYEHVGCMGDKILQSPTHRICRDWYIYLHEWLIFMVNVGSLGQWNPEIRVWILFSLVNICNSRKFKPFSHWPLVSRYTYTTVRPMRIRHRRSFVPLPWAFLTVHHWRTSEQFLLVLVKATGSPDPRGSFHPPEGSPTKKNTRKTWGFRVLFAYIWYIHIYIYIHVTDPIYPIFFGQGIF